MSSSNNPADSNSASISSEPKNVESFINSLSEASLAEQEQEQEQEQETETETGQVDVQDETEETEDQEQEQEQDSTSQSQTSSNAKKNKKKKLAARLKKKLGGGESSSNTNDDNDPPESSGTTSHFISTSTSSNSKASSSVPQLSNEQFDQMRKTVEKETNNPTVAKSLDNATLQKLFQALNDEKNSVQKSQQGKQKAQKALQDHKFWSTQPVIKPGDGPVSDEGPIEPNKPPSEVRSEPYPLPKDFEWVNVDIDDPTELQELFELLFQNYVEDDDAMMRFKYSQEFLHWVLKHPGYHKEWHVGVRVASSKKLVAFISGIPHELRVRETSIHSTEINFLCVHKKLRSKRLAPVLIKEVTRKCNLTGIFQAIYTGGIVLPTPISCSRYYHRTINAKKLCNVGFAAVPKGMNEQAFYKRYELENETKLKGLREMEEKDLEKCGKLLRKYMRRFDLAPRFNDEEVKHLFLSGRGNGEIDEKIGARKNQVTWTYVVEDQETGAITDMFAFYSLPSSILNHPTENTIHAAYLFYYASDSIFKAQAQSSTETTSSEEEEPTASTSNSISEPVEDWQKSKISGLSQEELKDEENILKWNDETKEMKSILKARLNELMNDALILSKKAGFDVVNCLTVMDNQLFINEQKFGPGDGFLRFYLFNWRVSPIAGGMGNRPGEIEEDPLFSSLKDNLISKSNQNASSSSSSSRNSSLGLTSEETEILMSSYPKAEWGSGNGIVMV